MAKVTKGGGGGSRNLLRQHLVDVRHVHLEAVLCLIDPGRHPLELPRCVQSGDRLGVDAQVAQRRLERGASAQRAAGEVGVVGGAEQEDALPSRGQSAVKNGMRTFPCHTVDRGKGKRELRTRSTSPAPCTPTPPLGRSRSTRRVCIPVSSVASAESEDFSHGAMMALAPVEGSCSGPSCEETAPIPAVGEGTWRSHPSSCLASSLPSSVYHDPAWVAALRVMLGGQ